MICFVTNEIAAGKRGGIGFYMEEAVCMLESQGLQTCLLVTAPQMSASEVEHQLRRRGTCTRVFNAADLAPTAHVPDAAFPHPGYAASVRVARALEQLCEDLPIRFVEFLDHSGTAFVPLRMKRLMGRFGRQVLAVRAHGTLEMVHISEQRRYGLRANLIGYFMERYGIRHADLLLAATHASLRQYEQFYQREGPAAVCPLPVRRITPEPLPFRDVKAPPCNVLCAGTVQMQKGMDRFVRAGVALCRRGLAGVRFVVMGRDFSTSPRYGSCAEELRRLVPDDLCDRFEFRIGYYDADDLLHATRECSFAVTPSRWETFCLVAHELRWLGTPQVLSRIGALEEHFQQGQDAVFFDGTVEDLAHTMEALLRGKLTMTGREDVASLYMDAETFAAPYLEAEPPAGTSLAAGTSQITVIVAPGPGKATETRQSVRASLWDEIELLSAEDEGAEAANRALEAARGKFVCCLPAGWRVDPDYLRLAVRALQRCPDAAYVGAWRRAPDGEVDTPYGLDPVLVTVEDGTGLSGGVVRRKALQEHNLRYDEGLFALNDWELAWSMAEQGLRGEVLPTVGLLTGPQPPIPRRSEYHLRQRMAELHPELVRQRPAEVLKAHIEARSALARETRTDEWLLRHFGGLRLLRLGVKRCLRQGARGVLREVAAKLKRKAGGER